MTVQSKALIAAFYGKKERLSYWNGCSTGGRQGLMEAQRYPADFDGVIAGAPANPQTHLHAWDMMVATTVLKDDQHFLTREKLATVNKAVIAACDKLDGVKDGLLNDPRKCHFDPAVLLCKGADSDSCLTAPQVDAVKLVYSAAKRKNGELIFPGKEPGSELGVDATQSRESARRRCPWARFSSRLIRTPTGTGASSIWIATSPLPTRSSAT